MADLTLNVAPTPDRTSVVLTFQVGADAIVAKTTPAELDVLIQGLAVTRATPSPSVSATHIDVAVQSPVPDHAVIPAEQADGKRLMLFRHPGYGWLSFELTMKSVLDLAAGLLPIIQSGRSKGMS